MIRTTDERKEVKSLVQDLQAKLRESSGKNDEVENLGEEESDGGEVECPGCERICEVENKGDFIMCSRCLGTDGESTFETRCICEKDG